MTTSNTELAAQAREFLDGMSYFYDTEVEQLQALARQLADALESKGEPVAWRSWSDKDGYGLWPTRSEAEAACAHDFEPEPLYAAPVQPEHKESAMSSEPEALRLAEALEGGWCPDDSPAEMRAAAAELRRLHADRAAMREIADVAHCGGLAGLSEGDALTLIRRLTLAHFDTSRPREHTAAAIEKLKARAR